MRWPAVLFAALLLTGCSSDGDSDYKDYYRVLRQGAQSALGDGAVSRQAVAAVSQASMGLRINNGSENLMVLASDTNGDRLWTSKDHTVVVTRDGRIVRTVGLTHDMGSLAPQTGQTLPSPAQALKQAYVTTRSADFPDIGAYAITLICSSAPAGPQRVTILGNVIATMRIDEHCSSVARNWDFTDSYWVDPQSGFTWRAQQHVHPNGDILTTETLRAPD